MVARKKQLCNRRVEKKRATNNFLQRPAPMNYQKSESMPQQKLSAMMTNTGATKELVDSALFEMIHDNKLPAQLADSVAFRKFCHVLKTRGPGTYTPVARKQIMEGRLDGRVATARAKRRQLHSPFGANGFSCGSDGARKNKHALVNFVMFPVAIGTISWTTKGASEHMEAGGVNERCGIYRDDDASRPSGGRAVGEAAGVMGAAHTIIDGASNNTMEMQSIRTKTGLFAGPEKASSALQMPPNMFWEWCGGGGISKEIGMKLCAQPSGCGSTERH
jgi:hypothetical protein